MQPNILFIMSDDHAAHALGCYGSSINVTPNLDRIAEGGMRFDNCHVSNSICAPSRAAILTGTYNHVNRVTTLDCALDNRLPNVAKHLRSAGYQTAMIGKWHLGHGVTNDPSGFDFWSILHGQGTYFDPEFLGPGSRRETVTGHVTDIITDKTIDWLERRDRSRPFFAMCHHKAPHRAWHPRSQDRSLYTDKIPVPRTFYDDYSNRGPAAAQFRVRVVDDMSYDDLDLVQPPDAPGDRLYGHHRRVPRLADLGDIPVRCRNSGEIFRFEDERAFDLFKYQRFMQKYLQTVHGIDENVGRLLDYLDDNDLTSDTVVVYTSDQGFFLGDHGWFDKRYMYEHSLRMPFIVRYPQVVKPGAVCEAMVSNVDFAPTFLELASAPVPSYMQGKSTLPLLRGVHPEEWPELVYHRYWMNRDSIVDAVAHYGVRTHRYKLIYWYDEPNDEPGAFPGRGVKQWELFDLEEDPDELRNVADSPRYASVLAEMTRQLECKMREIGDTPEHATMR